MKEKLDLSPDRRAGSFVWVWFLAVLLGFLTAVESLAWMGITSRVSVDSAGNQGDNNSSTPSISADGRYVAFYSNASNLVPGNPNSVYDVFVRDRYTGETTRVSVDSAGIQGNDNSYAPSISGDGRYVAFYSLASNLVPGDTNGTYDVFVHDRLTGETTPVSVTAAGTQGNSGSYYPSISGDGRYVAFASYSINLVSGDTTGWGDVFVRDRQTEQTTRVSVDSAGNQGNSYSWTPSISADGRYVAFHSNASNLVPGDTNVSIDIFVRDRQTGATTRVSVDSAGIQGNDNSYAPSISADGRYVAFYSFASNLVPGDTNDQYDVFVHDRQTGETTRVSVDSYGNQGNNNSYYPSISGDGRYVSFFSLAFNLVPGDTNGTWDVFVHDRQTGETTRVSVDSTGIQGNGSSSSRSSISGDGRYVAFYSYARNLVPGDTNGVSDVFVRQVPMEPVPQSSSVSFSVSASKAGRAIEQDDEVAAFCVYPVPGSSPMRWGFVLAGEARADATGTFPPFPVYGDNVATSASVEGCRERQEVSLLLWSPMEGKVYHAYRDGSSGGPVAVVWDNSLPSLTAGLDFIEGTRLPLRTGAWNLISYGVLKGWHKGTWVPMAPQIDNVIWEPVSNVGDSFPLKSIEGKYGRVLGNDGTGATFWNPALPTISTLSYLAPGYGYWVKMNPSSERLAWMTVPGALTKGTESLTLNPGWTLAGYWGNERTYMDNSVAYDASGELLPLTAWDFVPLSSIGDIWGSIVGDYVRVTSFDGQGAHLWNPLLMQTRTLRYLGPGNGYWIKMNAPGTLTYPTLVTPPTVQTLPVVTIGVDNASLRGMVNPSGEVTKAWFEWSGNSTLATYSSTPVQAVGAGATSLPVNAVKSGLLAGGTYYGRVAASNLSGTSRGTIVSFTPGTAPAVTTLSATSISSTGATLNGNVTPNGRATTVWFEWGTSSTLATYSSTPAQSVGSGATSLSTNAVLSGLSAGAMYYGRVVASNSLGMRRGTIVSFTAGAAPTVTTLAATSISSTGATLNGNVTPNGLATTTWFEWGTDSTLSAYSSTAPQSAGSGTTSQPVTAVLTGLSTGTTYYGRVAASNVLGTSRGTILNFTAGAAPTVTTATATSVTATGATLNGNVNPNGLATTVWFEWGTDSTLSTYSLTPTQSAGSGTTSQPVTALLTGLSTGTTYYGRVAANNSLGTTRGAIVSFTPGAAPTVTTAAATSVTATGATLNGSVNPNGLATTVWFEWGTSSTLSTYSSTATQSVGSGSTSQPVNVTLTGLSAGTTYYGRVAANNSIGTTRGTIVSFTPGASPTVTTLAATSISSTGATLNGNVTPNGLATTAWFEWGTSSTLSTYSSTPMQSAGSGTTSQPVNAALTGLSSGTTYYYRIAASNSSGTRRGGIASFRHNYTNYVGSYSGTWYSSPYGTTDPLDIAVTSYSNSTLTGYVNDYGGGGNTPFSSGYINGTSFHAVLYSSWSCTMDGTFSANGLTLSGTYQCDPPGYDYGTFTVTR